MIADYKEVIGNQKTIIGSGEALLMPGVGRLPRGDDFLEQFRG